MTLGVLNQIRYRKSAVTSCFLHLTVLRLLSATERNNDFGLAVVSRNIQNDVLEFIANNPSFSSVVVRSKSQYRLFGFNSDFTSDSAQGIIAVQRAAQGSVGVEFAKTLGINARVAYSDLVENTERILLQIQMVTCIIWNQGTVLMGATSLQLLKLRFFRLMIRLCESNYTRWNCLQTRKGLSI